MKTLFWIAVGAAGALQADRWLRSKRAQLTPNAMTGTLLDKLNARLESKRGAESRSRV
jgi:hypothetical protein